MDISKLNRQVAARKWESERANLGAYERWEAQSKGRAAEHEWATDTAIRRADKVATLEG